MTVNRKSRIQFLDTLPFYHNDTPSFNRSRGSQYSSLLHTRSTTTRTTLQMLVGPSSPMTRWHLPASCTWHDETHSLTRYACTISKFRWKKAMSSITCKKFTDKHFRNAAQPKLQSPDSCPESLKPAC
eukprot:2928323-Amphidinium_carterae.2